MALPDVKGLRDAGCSPAMICALRLGEVSIEDDAIMIRQPGSGPVECGSAATLQRYVERRAELALDCSPAVPLIVDLEGRPFSDERLQAHYEAARTVRVALEANGSFCRALLSLIASIPPGHPGPHAWEGDMYNHDDQNLFVIDGHMHFWDANPENWKNKYGESWIKCFHAFHSGLSPVEEVWPFEKFCRYDEETLANDLFRNGYVDMAILNSTYLYEFYKNGFNSHVQNNVIKAKYPDRFLLCGSLNVSFRDASRLGHLISNAKRGRLGT